MQLDSAEFSRNADAQQVQTLCDDLDARAQSMQYEQELLMRLVDTTAPRSYQSNRYRDMLGDLRIRFARLRTVIARYCR